MEKAKGHFSHLIVHAELTRIRAMPLARKSARGTRAIRHKSQLTKALSRAPINKRRRSVPINSPGGTRGDNSVPSARRDAAQVANTRASAARAAKCAYFRLDDTSSSIGCNRGLNKWFLEPTLTSLALTWHGWYVNCP